MTLLERFAGALSSRGLSLVGEDETPDPEPPNLADWQRRAALNIADAEARSQFTHRCGPDCEPAPYLGPVRLGRRDEPWTEGR